MKQQIYNTALYLRLSRDDDRKANFFWCKSVVLDFCGDWSCVRRTYRWIYAKTCKKKNWKKCKNLFLWTRRKADNGKTESQIFFYIHFSDSCHGWDMCSLSFPNDMGCPICPSICFFKFVDVLVDDFTDNRFYRKSSHKGMENCK